MQDAPGVEAQANAEKDPDAEEDAAPAQPRRSTRNAPTVTRTSPESDIVPHPTCPANAAPWFKQNFALLDLRDPHHLYSAVLDAWCRLEATNDFAVGKGNKAGNNIPKPPQLKEWIQAGRASRSKRMPRVVDIDKFSQQMWTWWAAMQPEWRKVDATGQIAPSREVSGSGWGSALDVRGQNGILSVVACICWWGLALERETPERCRSWRWFMEDVVWVVNQMIKDT
ncbi:hypothetical protein K525DRAFT_211617 [Schizophyllum commune Loenen D]|nr:hypothetical protein K525DRAFT_211617 [Schizophyllum commune Loenen D]